MNRMYDHEFVVYESLESIEREGQVDVGGLDKLDGLNLDNEDEYIRVCRHFPECPYTPPPGDEDCPGCRASEQYSDEGAGLILADYRSSVSS